VPPDRLVDLIDRSALERDLDFRPRDRFRVELRDDG
jgi:hypothetical protein